MELTLPHLVQIYIAFPFLPVCTMHKYWYCIRLRSVFMKYDRSHRAAWKQLRCCRMKEKHSCEWKIVNKWWGRDRKNRNKGQGVSQNTSADARWYLIIEKKCINNNKIKFSAFKQRQIVINMVKEKFSSTLNSNINPPLVQAHSLKAKDGLHFRELHL